MRAKLIRQLTWMTRGAVYDVISEDCTGYILHDDRGTRRTIPANYFDVIPDEPSTETAATTNVVEKPIRQWVRLRPFHPKHEKLRPIKGWGLKFGEYYEVTKVETAFAVTNVQILRDGQTDYYEADWFFAPIVSETKPPAAPREPHELFKGEVSFHEFSTVKPSNPKDVIGSTKASLCCVPCGPLFEVGAAMLDGSAKYGRHNWRVIGVRASVYYEAALRHLMKYWEGEDLDKDSGVHHLAHVAACCLIARDAAMSDKLDDDRPPVTGDPTDCVKDLIPAIKARYPDPKKPFTERETS